jgi:Ser/Thr protein kinase RdoA (MazF antagonist)
MENHVTDTSPPLQHWPTLVNQPVSILEGGLINATWAVGDPPRGVVQRLHAIFAPEVNEDIAAITAHLKRRGMPSPELLRTTAGELSVLDAEGACWRALSWVEGTTIHAMDTLDRARAAGTLVGRWHAAVDDLDHAFHFTRSGVHDTEAHMASLVSALDAHPHHRLRDVAAPLMDTVLALWERWDGDTDAPTRICHGDLKISNLRFSADGQRDCLLDLDTMGRLSLDVEIGDAWRSWCNRRGEDLTQAHFDPEIMEASMRGYLSERPLSREERAPLPGGVERICLELSARFLTDTLHESYFGWNPEAAPTRGEHNLLRAQGQMGLAESVREQRASLERILNALD